MTSNTTRRNNDTIEGRLPSSKYVEEFNKRTNESGYSTKYIIHLIVNLHGCYGRFDMIQDMLLDKGLPVDNIKKTSAAWRDNIGKIYSGKIGDHGHYSLKAENFANKDEKIELKAKSTSVDRLRSLLDVIGEYTAAYERDNEQKKLEAHV